MARLFDNGWARWLPVFWRGSRVTRPQGGLRVPFCPAGGRSSTPHAEDSFRAWQVAGDSLTHESCVASVFAWQNLHPATGAVALQKGAVADGGIVGRALRLPPFLFALVILAVQSPATSKPIPLSGKQVEHNLAIVHPGDATAKAVPHTLVQTFDADGNPTAYSMWVDSVICREKVCDVVKVRLLWDALGRYQNYQVALGAQLTKLDHVPFTQKDLAKLQEILSDTDSPLREVEKEAMIAKAPAKPEQQADGVAAVSQPTILTLKNAVIIGAGYTCYDLWHWANGLLTQQIRDFTGKDSSTQKLLAYLSSNDQHEAYFALEYLAKRKITAPAVFAAVIDRCKRGDPSLVDPALAYLRQAAPSDQAYYDAIVELFSVPDSKKRVLILEELSSKEQQAAAGFYDQLCDYLPSLESYFEVHRFLTLMEEQNPGSTKVAEKTAKLLQHKKFFISRRAYWFLEKQTLPADLQKVVDDYAGENEDRL